MNEVVPAKDLMATAERWAKTIAESSPLSIQATKQAALEGLGKLGADQLNWLEADL